LQKEQANKAVTKQSNKENDAIILPNASMTAADRINAYYNSTFCPL